MKLFLKFASLLGVLGVMFGAFGAHGIKGHVSEQHYSSYRVGIEYLYFHLAPLLYLATRNESKNLKISGYLFFIGILFFTGSNLLMTTEEMHHINFHFLWPITPLGGVLMLLGWVMLLVDSFKKA